jgi:hypothetical protein
MNKIKRKMKRKEKKKDKHNDDDHQLLLYNTFDKMIIFIQ